MLGTKLLCAAALLAVSTGLAAATPATVQKSTKVRAGPGAGYPVVASLPRRSVVDVAGCTRGWCQIDWQGRQGYVVRSALALAGTPPAVAAAPGYYEGYYDSPTYFGPDYYDYPGYAYGPGVGVYVSPRWHRGHHGWRHRPGGPGWAGHPPRGPGWTGNTPAPGAVSPGGVKQPRAAFGQVGGATGFRGGAATGGFRGGGAAMGGGFGGGMRGGTVGSAPAAAAPAGGGLSKGGMTKR
jgi:uncharacterized protein YraI